MLQAYRFAPDPVPAQARSLASHCGASRKAFNEGLAQVKRCLDQRAAERSYGVPEDQLTEVPWTLPALRRWWNASKDEIAPWWRGNSKEAYNSGLDALARGLACWSGSRSGKRRGPRVGFPRFKSRRRSRVSCRLRALQRQAARRRGPVRGTGLPPSNRWRRAQARVGRVHARAANLRRDTLHKATTALAQRHPVIVVEDLNMAGMSRRKPGAGRGGRGLNRAIADAAPAELRRQLGCKTIWYGSQLLVADRWYPSSKTCSAFGAVKAKLALAERIWTCDGCGATHDRDLNAAINLARLSEHALRVDGRPAGSGPVAGRGAIRKTGSP